MSQSTREKLINAAIKVFSQKGYFNTKISDIVKEAEVAQGTFYIYFNSKKDIFSEIVNSVTSQIESTIDRFYKEKGEDIKIIKDFAGEIFKILYQYRDIAYIFFFQVMCMEEEFKNIYFQTSQKIKDFYQKKTGDSLKAEILVGYGKRLVEFDVLIEKKPMEEVLDKFMNAVYLVLGV